MGAISDHMGRQVTCVRRAPLPVADFRHVFAVLADVLLMLDELVVKLLLQIVPLWRSICGRRSITSITRWKRSRSFSTVMSNGVVMVPSSLYPRT